jgi:hypothetical protein
MGGLMEAMLATFIAARLNTVNTRNGMTAR